MYCTRPAREPLLPRPGRPEAFCQKTLRGGVLHSGVLNMSLTSVSPVPPPAKRVPATILTGFLGAGKTSLIQNLVRSVPRGARFAFLINEFGSVGLDKTQLTGCGLANCQDEDVLELANGCICCTVADDFLPAMRKILDRNPDHILIETSGLALPRPLVRAFAWPDIKTRAVVHGVIAVVDAYALAHNDYTEDRLALERQRQADPALDHESPIQEVFWDQVGCADLVILNKCDKITADQGLAVKRELTKKLPRVKCVSSHAASVPPELFFDLENLEDKRHPGSTDPDAHHDDDDEDHHHDDHDHEAFVSHVLHLGPVEDAASLQIQLGAPRPDTPDFAGQRLSISPWSRPPRGAARNREPIHTLVRPSLVCLMKRRTLCWCLSGYVLWLKQRCARLCGIF